ncbi:MAG: mandelate racemase/muconate lactonizing enzyme family protein [Bacteroidota bacterium]
MKRKDFIKNVGLGAFVGFSNLVPNAINASERQSSGLKITDVKSFLFKKANFIKIETNEGISGWGESDGSNKKFAANYLATNLKKYIIGKDPFDSEAIWHECYLKGLEAGIAGIHPGTLAGVDNALWDLKGKYLKMPVHKLLGGNGLQKIRVYGSFSRDKGDTLMTPQEMAKKAEWFVSQGYKAVKTRMAIRQENIDPYPDDTFECIKAVRNAIGDDIELFVDMNNGYSPAKAIMMSKKLYEHFNIAAMEEPVFQQDYAGLKQVVDALDIPVMAGEHEYSKWMIKDLITQANVDIVNADVIKCGGITECKKVAGMVHAFGKQIMVHNAKPTLATAASLQLLASIPNGARFQEYAGKRLEQNYGPVVDLFDNYFEFKDGFLMLPDLPGLGLEIDEKMVLKHMR